MEVARANNGGRWQSGQSGNPSGLPGRPLGSRAAFSRGFTRDLAEVWQAKGKEAMNWTADNKPTVFFATCARLLPTDEWRHSGRRIQVAERPARPAAEGHRHGLD